MSDGDLGGRGDPRPRAAHRASHEPALPGSGLKGAEEKSVLQWSTDREEPGLAHLVIPSLSRWIQSAVIKHLEWTGSVLGTGDKAMNQTGPTPSLTVG